MKQQPYLYKQIPVFKYIFTSGGKTRIEKMVIFAPTPVNHVFNLGFGDLLADGSINDTANSNNGDILKVLVTVIEILKDFTTEYPAAKIFFKGSTSNRTALYRRIIKTYFRIFSNEFIISALVETKIGYKEIAFDPGSGEVYFGFFIKRID